MSQSPSEPRAADGRIVRQQNERLVYLAIAVASYALDTIFLALYAAMGVVSAHVPLAYGGIALGFNALFYLFIARGWNLRARDPSMTNAQTAAGYGMQLCFLAAAPEAGFVFLVTFFVVSSFAVLTMTLRQVIVSWTLVSIAAVTLVVLLGAQIDIPVETAPMAALTALVMVSALGRSILIAMRISELRHRLSDRNRRLTESFKEIERLAGLDDLTQTMNRRTFLETVEQEASRASRTGHAFSLALLDLDHFKAVNDSYGHMAGDQVLREFAAATRDCLRAADRLGRFGGEEFIIMLPDTTLDGARALAERVRTAVAARHWDGIASGLTVTVSIGLAEYRRGEPVGELIARADAALYEAKRTGRNRTMTAASAA